MSFNMDMNSVKNIIPGANQVMVYGWGHCKYIELTRTLADKGSGSPVQKVFDCSLGNKQTDEDKKTTLEGHKIHQFDWDHSTTATNEKRTARQCKSGLTNLVFENYFRHKQGLPIIPVLFCFDIDSNPYSNKIDAPASRDTNLNDLITHRELRRCYKLAQEITNDPNLKELADIAHETFKFVKIKDNGAGNYSLEKVVPFWDNTDFKKGWFNRQLNKKAPDPVDKKIYQWRQLVANELATLKMPSKLPALSSNDFAQFAFSISELMNNVHPDMSCPTQEELRNWLVANKDKTDFTPPNKLDKIAESYGLNNVQELINDSAFKALYEKAKAMFV